MIIELNKVSESRLGALQELKLNKQQLNFSAGQILNAAVRSVYSNHEVLLTINGQDVNAKTTQQFMPGQLLQVKVVASQPETILEVYKTIDPSLLQMALRATLPRQAPATHLLMLLQQLQYTSSIPAALSQQINSLLHSLPNITQLAQYLPHAINQSGLFFESSLAPWRQGLNAARLKGDFKGQCFSLLQQLPLSSSPKYLNVTTSIQEDTLPLRGATPQPLSPEPLMNLSELSLTTIQQLLREYTEHVLARITAQQVNHLVHQPHQGYLLMLDLPVLVDDHYEIIPLMIEHHKAEPQRPSQWSISFALNLCELGGLQGRVSLGGHALELDINTEIESTMLLLKTHQQELEQLFDEQGLNLKHLRVQLGLKQNNIDATTLHLLDIRV